MGIRIQNVGDETKDTTEKQAPRNVIVFGETGAGKSSVINMICGMEVAETSDSAKGVTFQSTPYRTTLPPPNSFPITLWDTAGLNEGDGGRVSNKDAIVNLHQLIHDLDERGGVSLLIYCKRGPRITAYSTKNYEMFYSSFCQKEVPIIMLVIGGESLEDGWWSRNEAEFRRQKMVFAGQACVIATKMLKGHSFEEEYNESAAETQKLIHDHCAPKPWQAGSASDWFVKVLKPIILSFEWLNLSRVVRYALLDDLKEFGGMNHKDAVKHVKEVEAGLKEKRRLRA